ncbi:hypothetical protein DPMN_128542 [Dreissena polymorpha]|uniref:Uncharacterized protein n=1 Tax=Dreissena polymorpha TaxID=45954 RepID=A0A9D4H3B1_DREPO|nr:hypothetical protein DPMN_128542 [Dreissena polymorpha]
MRTRIGSHTQANGPRKHKVIPLVCGNPRTGNGCKSSSLFISLLALLQRHKHPSRGWQIFRRTHTRSFNPWLTSQVLTCQHWHGRRVSQRMWKMTIKAT